MAAAARDLEVPSDRDIEAIAEMEKTVALAASGDGPIVVGPWLSEVGFEVLYWIPFLRWARERFGLDSHRLVALSRGGTEAWYAGICDRYIDVFELVTVQEYVANTQARWAEEGGQKQIAPTRWDQLVLERAAGRLDSAIEHVLHPSIMYRLFRPFWLGKASQRLVDEHTRLERFALSGDAQVEELLPDEDYVAVKFYARPSFPDSRENRRLVTEIVHALAEETAVVLLNTGIALDDHADFDLREPGRVIDLVGEMRPANNLHVQSVAIGRATAFAGTYGGLAYLASSLGVPAVALWSEPEALVPSHLEVGRRTAEVLGAPLSALGTGDLEVLQAIAWPRPTPAKTGTVPG